MDVSLVIVAVASIGLGAWMVVVQFRGMVKAPKGALLSGHIKLFISGLGLILVGILELINGTW